MADGIGLLFTSAFVNGNANEDTLNFAASVMATSTVQGGANDDTITIGTLTSGRVNGNKADDTVTVNAAVTAEVFGGQGDDTLNIGGAITGTEVNGALGNDGINSQLLLLTPALPCVVVTAMTTSRSPVVLALSDGYHFPWWRRQQHFWRQQRCSRCTRHWCCRHRWQRQRQRLLR